MNVNELPVTFECENSRLIGMLHQPDSRGKRGVLIIVGGPQTRVGSHRQFVLLARFLSENGVPVFRFDYRGKGDSEGAPRSFEQVSNDIKVAIDEFQNRSAVTEVVLWGLCDAASAASFYAHTDPRVKGMVLVNPWVRTEAGIARAYIKSHYLKRFFSLAFWRKIGSGEFQFLDSMRSFIDVLKQAFVGRGVPYNGGLDRVEPKSLTDLPDRMAEGISHFSGMVLVILSGKDLTAQEFRDTIKSSNRWRNLFVRENLTKSELPDADHTFTQSIWRKQVEKLTLDWLKTY